MKDQKLKEAGKNNLQGKRNHSLPFLFKSLISTFRKQHLNEP